jgi:uncharacterized membrane protein
MGRGGAPPNDGGRRRTAPLFAAVVRRCPPSSVATRFRHRVIATTLAPDHGADRAVREDRMIRELHIAGGVLALVGGAIALAASKGSPTHRLGGRVFLVAMLVMTGCAAWSAAFLKPNRVNLMAALLAMYLVVSATLALKPALARARPLLAASIAWALTLSAFAFRLALEGAASAGGMVDRIPVAPIVLFGSVALVAAAMDARLWWTQRLEGPARLVRHLWRMCFALWMAATSLFIGQPRYFPEWLRQRMELRAIPVLLVMAVGLYWLGRLLITRRAAPVPSPTDAPPRRDEELA